MLAVSIIYQLVSCYEILVLDVVEALLEAIDEATRR
jgi:hypothetical protein